MATSRNLHQVAAKPCKKLQKKTKVIKALQPGMFETTSMSRLRSAQERKQLLLQQTPESLRGNPYEMCQFDGDFYKDLKASYVRNELNKIGEQRPKALKVPLPASPAVPCPLGTCPWTLNGPNMLAHYLGYHNHLLVPVREICDLSKPIQLVVPLARIDLNRNRLFGAFVFRRAGLSPFNGLRNANLPEAYGQYAKHTFVMFFACRTDHYFLTETPNGVRKQLKELLVIWATTPTPQVPLMLKGVITEPMGTRTITKVLKIRSVNDDQTVKRFIEHDSNCMISTMEELKKVNGAHRQVVDLSVLIKDNQ